MDREKMIIDEMVKTAVESALAKGRILTAEEIDAERDALADFLRQYDWVVVVWPDGEKMGAIIVRETAKEDGYMRANSLPVDCEATALKLFELCRAPDNVVREPQRITH